MKNIIMRLRCKKGESLIESMAAILIFTLASIIMLTMVTASADINKAAKEAEKVYHEPLLKAENVEFLWNSTVRELMTDTNLIVRCFFHTFFIH